MRQLRELLSLHFDQGLSQRLIARSLGVVRSTIERTLKRFALAELSWPLPAELGDAALEQALYQQVAHPGLAKSVARPNYAAALRELQRKGVTRQLLWQEYRAQHPEGIGYSVYCDELAAYRSDQDLAYRHDHQPGVRGYFDFAGTTVRYANENQVAAAQIFVAALGYSNAIFAYAYPDQTAPRWLDGQARAFSAFGGVPQILVPDNPKALLARACNAEPQLTALYRDFAEHYQATVIPARVRKPKDKAAVEGAVKVVTLRLASARDRVFDSLSTLNTWLTDELKQLNDAPFQKRVGSRSQMLAEERSALQPLPAQGFVMPHYLQRKVARDYHVDVARRYYSVPHQHVGKRVEVRVTHLVEVLLEGERIALHTKRDTGPRHVTEYAHMPVHHQRYRDPKLHLRARAMGVQTTAVIEALFQRRVHPELAIRSASGVLGLARDHGKAALEAACGRALELNAISYGHIKSLLLAARQNAGAPHAAPCLAHEHVRGAGYFAGQEPNHVA